MGPRATVQRWQEPFEVGNYNTVTYSAAEWLFVVNPKQGLEQLGLDEWPGTEREREVPRVAHPFEHFKAKLDEVSEKLRSVGETSMSVCEFAALRAYTGPLYVALATIASLMSLYAPSSALLSVTRALPSPWQLREVQWHLPRRVRHRLPSR